MADGKLIFETAIENKGALEDADSLKKEIESTDVTIKPKVDTSAAQSDIKTDVEGMDAPKLTVRYETADGWVEEVRDAANKVLSVTPIEAPIAVTATDEAKAKHEAFIADLEQRKINAQAQIEASKEQAQAAIDTAAKEVTPPEVSFDVDPDMTDAEREMGWLEKKIEGMSTPVATAVGAALGTLIGRVGAAVLNRIFDEFKEAMKENEEISASIERMETSIDNAFGKLVNALSPAIVSVVDLLSGLITIISDVVAGIIGIFIPPQSQVDKEVAESKKALADYKKAIDEVNEALDKALGESRIEKATAAKLVDEYENLQTKGKQTEEEIARMQSIARKLALMYPEMGDSINENTGLYENNTIALRENVQAQGAQKDQTAYLENINSLEQEQLKYLKEQASAVEKRESARAEMKSYQDQAESLGALSKGFEASGYNLAMYGERLLAVSPDMATWIKLTEDGTYAIQDGVYAEQAYDGALAVLDRTIAEANTSAEEQNKLVWMHNDAVENAGEEIEKTTADIEAKTLAMGEAGEVTKQLTTAEEDAAAAEAELAAQREAAARKLTETNEALKGQLAQIVDMQDRAKASALSQLDSVARGFKGIAEAEEAASVTDMGAGLEAQAEYFTKYTDALEELKALGYDEDIVAELSGGSPEELAQIQALVEAAKTSETAVDDMNTKWKEAQDARELAATAMQEASLKANDEYQTLLTTTAEMVAGLDQSELADTNIKATLDAIAARFTEETPKIQANVDALKAVLSGAGTSTDSTATPTDETPQETLAAVKQQVTAETSDTVAELDAIIAKINEYVTNLAPTLHAIISGGREGAVTAGAEFMQGAGEGISGVSLDGSVDGVINTAINRANSYRDRFVIVGEQITGGIASGIVRNVGAVEEAVQYAISQALAAAQAAGEISSPSKLFSDEVGNYLAQGIGMGFTGAMPDLLDDIRTSLSVMPSQIRPEPSLNVDYGALANAVRSGAPKGGGVIKIFFDGKEMADILTEPLSQNLEYEMHARR